MCSARRVTALAYPANMQVSKATRVAETARLNVPSSESTGWLRAEFLGANLVDRYATLPSPNIGSAEVPG